MKTIKDVAGITEIVQVESLKPEPVIYFLLLGDEVVYVGQSLKWTNRINAHRRYKNGEFDAVAILPVPMDSLHEEERKWIEYFNPKLNGTFAPHLKDRPRRKLGPLPYRATNMLQLAKLASDLGYENTHAIAALSADDLLALPGFGEKSLVYVRQYFAELGMQCKI